MMKKNYLALICLTLALLIPYSGNCFENWSENSPNESDIGQGAFIQREYLELYVPKTFEGRTAKEWRTVHGIQLQNAVRFYRTTSKVQLRGSVTVFDFDYTQDNLDIQVFRSRARRPGTNSCMDCHGGEFARTTAIIGQEHQELISKPVKRGKITFTLNNSTKEAFHAGVNHWLSHNLLAKLDYKWGYLKQGRHNLQAKAWTLGLSGMIKHKWNWSTDLIYSKTDSYKSRKTFVGKLNYFLSKGLRLGVSGGAFLDGYTHFGTEMSEMGLVSMGLEKDDPTLLPTLFTKLKNDMFGYLQYTVEYEYKF